MAAEGGTQDAEALQEGEQVFHSGADEAVHENAKSITWRLQVTFFNEKHGPEHEVVLLMGSCEGDIHTFLVRYTKAFDSCQTRENGQIRGGCVVWCEAGKTETLISRIAEVTLTRTERVTREHPEIIRIVWAPLIEYKKKE